MVLVVLRHSLVSTKLFVNMLIETEKDCLANTKYDLKGPPPAINQISLNRV